MPETLGSPSPVALHGVVPGARGAVQSLHGNRGAAVTADQSGAGDNQVRGKRDPNRRVIDVHCSGHGGPGGFTNLVVTKRDGLIEMDPHVTGQCLIIFDEKAATELFQAIGEWLE